MSYIETFFPGQISLNNLAPPAPAADKYFAGQGTKIEVYQMNYAMTANHPHMPFPYNPTLPAHADTIFGELDREQWLKFILLELEWGKLETSDGVYNFDFLDFVFDTIRSLPRATGQNKKVMLLFNFRNPGQLTGLEGLLPQYLLTQPTANGGYYKNTTSFNPANTNPVVNAKKFDHVWCYEAANPNAPGGATVDPRGYNMNLYKFTASAGTNILKTKYYAMIAAVKAHFANDDVFGGIMTTEAAIGSPFASVVGGVTTTWESGNGRDQNYEGRLNILKHLRSEFEGYIIAEDCNFDTGFYRAMTDAGVPDGLIANALGFAPSDMHTGTNLNLANILSVLKGKVAILMQAQPLTQQSMSGNRPNFFNWPTNPSQILGGDGTAYNDPPTAQWIMDRFRYFGATHIIFQRNFSTTASGSSNTNIQNWNKWKAFMRASPYANDLLGGADGTRPQFAG